jgi:hypothetical protein
MEASCARLSHRLRQIKIVHWAVIGNAVRVMRIAIGEEADDVIDDGKDPAAKALGAKGGKKRGGNARP